jgi:secreted trypsin-like serine protease
MQWRRDGLREQYIVVNTVEESQADLALINLEEDAEILFPAVAPARANIRSNDPVIVVGYGADTVRNRLVSFSDPQPTRRFGKNRVTLPGNEKFTIEAPGSLALPGDSGGPCFREDTDGLALVGINSRSSPGKKSTFTSTYSYLNWLDAEIQRANQM